jgi:hypothetical protein
MSYVKVYYRRIWLFGFIPLPFRHTFLEVDNGLEVVRKGFYPNDSTWLFLGSTLMFVKGGTRSESIGDYWKIVSGDKVEVKMILKEIKKVKWQKFHALRRNCFHWRNEVLKRSGIEVPRDSWFG